MTTKNSICIKCEHNYCSSNAVCETDSGRGLVATCLYGGKNAGNRKSCKRFEKAPDNRIAERLNALEGKDKK